MEINLKLGTYIDYEVSRVMPLKGKFGYRVFLIYMDGSKTVQQKSGFSSPKEAAAARDKTIGELYAGTYIVHENVRLKDFLHFWLEEDIRKRAGSQETYLTFSRAVRLHIIPNLGNRKMAEINRGEIQKLYNEKAEYSESVARLVKTVMNVSMNYAVEQKIITENPAKDVTLPKSVKKKKYHTRNIDTQKTLTMEQILILLEASKETSIHMMVLFNVLMGLRRREILGVKYTDIDYINRTLRVQRQLGVKLGSEKEEFAPKTYGKQEVRLKTKSSYRELPIPDYVFEAILEERKRYEKNRSRRKKTFQDDDYICCSSYGKPRSKDYHYTKYKKLLKDNNLPDIRWHDLRSTYCTMLLKNDFNPKGVSKLMGHAKEIITMDVYGDKRGIITDCLDELQPYIEQLFDEIEERNKDRYESEEVLIDVTEYIEEYAS